eukprot:g8579.t1 g8579   contig3:420646-421454(-)
MAALSQTYPINTLMELTLQQSSNTPSTTAAAAATTTLRGLIYCTDATSNSIVLKRSLVHTTLSSEITIINADSVVDSKKIEVNVNEMEEENSNTRELLEGVCSVEEYKQIGNGGVLPNVSRKALEERERRAIRLAEESFSHVNQKATPEGQKIFDKLLKACNEVIWNGESILVLNHIRVDPPYTAEDCSLVTTSGGRGGGTGSGLDGHSLDRVKKIVSAASV